MKTPDKIKEVKVFKTKNATIKVYIPDLTEEERAFRMKQIHDAAADLLRYKLSQSQ